MNQKKRVTQQDVANLAGVSTAVVSYVINDGPRPTSDEVRKRVLQAIEELDYHPNVLARGLRAGNSNTIAFIDHDYHAMGVFTSAYTAPILTGIMEQLKAHGYYILVYPLVVGEAPTNVEMLLRSGRVDGVFMRLVETSPKTDPLLELVAETGIPCVCIEEPGASRFGFSAVTYDNAGGAFDATTYLLEQGHRRTAHIAGNLRFGTARARLEGYQRALVNFGLPLEDTLVSGGDWGFSQARASVAQFLSLTNPPTAIFAASDRMAAGAIAELLGHGYRVPQDVAVIGFDDIEMAGHLTPPLTTVHIPLIEIGQCAADMILERVQAGPNNAPRTVVLPLELTRRGSA